MKKRRFKNRQFHGSDDDPLSGMANLFDLAMVFAVALMVAVISSMHLTDLLKDQKTTVVVNPGQPDMEIIVKDGKKIDKYKSAEQKGQGKGKKVGTAYQLATGEIIYVPE
ncbi:MAG: hypothetical protein CSA81_11265 [Acidobacteria bacterium]|nr:MAG: hypothetical protein CSA81_11265 [Acidobacteriota bacterium]PIE89954.1 MAG: hypothetical protein CR997_08225 [Acidobacteriota bacterium]